MSAPRPRSASRPVAARSSTPRRCLRRSAIPPIRAAAGIASRTGDAQKRQPGIVGTLRIGSADNGKRDRSSRHCRAEQREAQEHHHDMASGRRPAGHRHSPHSARRRHRHRCACRPGDGHDAMRTVPVRQALIIRFVRAGALDSAGRLSWERPGAHTGLYACRTRWTGRSAGQQPGIGCAVALRT